MGRLLLCLALWPATLVGQVMGPRDSTKLVVTTADSTVSVYFTLRFDSLHLRTTTPPAPTLASLALAPRSASLQAGLTQTFTATASWTDGKPHPLTVAWSATGGTISSGGLYTAGASAGSYRVVASASGKADTASVTVTAVPPPPPPPDTTPPPPAATCTGTQVTPANWSSAANSAGNLCLRAGTYAGLRITTPNKTVRGWPGEDVIIGQLEVYGANTTLWNLHIVGKGTEQFGINCRAPGFKLINSVIESANKSGVGFWAECSGEVTGNLVVRNGTHAPGGSCYDHGIYANGQNAKLIRDNIIVGNLCYGIHLYAGDGSQFMNGITLRRNIVFGHTKWADLIIGSTNNPASGIVVDSNFTDTEDIGWVWGVAKHKDLTLRWNTWKTAPTNLGKWATLTQTGNVTGYPKAVVLPNPYEAGRANVVLYAAGAVDLSAVVKPGQPFTIRKVLDFYGTPALTGTYSGPVTIPATSYPAAFVVLPR